jgi:hypothetical protein
MILLNNSVTTLKIFLGFEVLTAAVLKSSIISDMTPCNPLEVNRRFGGKYRHVL